MQLVCATDAFGAAVSEGVDGGEMFLVVVTNSDFTWPSRSCATEEERSPHKNFSIVSLGSVALAERSVPVNTAFSQSSWLERSTREIM